MSLIKRNAPEWNREQVAAHFEAETQAYIEAARPMAKPPLTVNKIRELDFHGHGLKILEAVLWAKAKLSIQTVLDLGCGPGRFCPFFSELLGLDYIGVDANPKIIEYCQETYRRAGAVNFKRERLADIDIGGGAALTSTRSVASDLLFTHGVLMHVPATDIGGAALAMQDRAWAIMLCEKVRMDRSERSVLAPHVWLHDYPALFGEPIYREPLNSTKDIFIFRGRS